MSERSPAHGPVSELPAGGAVAYLEGRTMPLVLFVWKMIDFALAAVLAAAIAYWQIVRGLARA